MNYFFVHTGVSVLAGAALLLIAAALWPFSAEVWLGVVTGFVLAAVFVTGGFISFYRGIKSGQRAFNRILFVSILVRLMLAAVAIVVLMKFTAIDPQAMLISLFSWYLVLQIGEIIGFHKLNMGKV